MAYVCTSHVTSPECLACLNPLSVILCLLTRLFAWRRNRAMQGCAALHLMRGSACHQMPPHSLADPPNQAYISQAHSFRSSLFEGVKPLRTRRRSAGGTQRASSASSLLLRDCPAGFIKFQAAAGSAVSCCPHNMLAQTAGCQGLWRYALVCACKISYTPCLECICSQASHTACRLMCLPASHLCADSQTRSPPTQRGN